MPPLPSPRAGKFCFHTAKTSHVLSKEDVRRLLGVMRDAGAAKLNIAGGEPFLHPALLGDMVTHAKQVRSRSTGAHVRRLCAAEGARACH